MTTRSEAMKSRGLKQGIALRRVGRLRAALAHFRELRARFKNDVWVVFYLAVTLDNLGKEREAIGQYHRALRLEPGHPRRYEILLYLASSYRKKGRPAAARRHLRKVQRMGRASALERRLRRMVDRDRRRS